MRGNCLRDLRDWVSRFLGETSRFWYAFEFHEAKVLGLLKKSV